ncbi:MAG: DUF1576 domain-containing protein [Oscillospiraceae bacterium]|nr:DUF1576 domain-containing protein [Oscillospiraceae bacterium]
MANYFKSIHTVFFITLLIFIGAAFVIDPSLSIFRGFEAILRSPDILVTDYVYVGGLGAAILNSAITSLLALGMLIVFNHEAKSATISNLWLVLGFAFFGKNPLTVIPIFFGGWLYSRFMKQSFNVNILTCLVAASMSPAVTQKVFIGTGSDLLNVVFAICMGVLIGFIFDPMAKNIFKAHDGFNLYNAGFTAGMLAIIITSIFASYNIAYEMNDQWSSGNNLAIGLFLSVVSLFLVFVGLYMHRDVPDAFKKLLTLRKQHNDYYPTYGYVCYVNMGVLGLFCTFVALFVIRIEINGLVLGAILSVMGFGANGKQIFSVSSLMAGVALGTLLSPWNLQDPGVAVAFFFVACLSPIPAKFGWHWGVIAGVIHLHLVTSLAVPSGGINLYNNGVAAGFVTVLLLPIIRAIHQRRETISAG